MGALTTRLLDGLLDPVEANGAAFVSGAGSQCDPRVGDAFLALESVWSKERSSR